MIVLIPVIAIIGFALTVLTRKRALKNNQLDVPNERSSHLLPTPHGAGIAIVISFVAGLLVMLLNETISNRMFLTLALPGTCVAIIGRLDDLGRLTSAKWRLVGHFCVAILTVALAAGLPALPLADSAIDFGFAGDIAAVIYLVWLLNLFNFMDGIDLITAAQTITMSSSVAMLLVIKTESNLWYVIAVLGAAVIGFAFLNLPPAKIFLGDVGSGFIGFTIAAISILVAKEEPLIAWSLIIMIGVFVSDATVTLLRRIIARERVYVAHRTHAYQHLAKKMNSHLPISLGVGAINIIWLLPIAWFVADGKLLPITGLLVAYIPLIILAIYLNAGRQSAN